MNLIQDKWIPVERRDRSYCLIAPWEIGASDNPVMEIKAPRPDLICTHKTGHILLN